MHCRLTIPYLLASFAFAISAPTASAQASRPLEPIAAKLQPTRTVVYKTVGTRQLHLHIFEPTGHQPGDRRSAYMAIHGGGWTGGNARKFYPHPRIPEDPPHHPPKRNSNISGQFERYHSCHCATSCRVAEQYGPRLLGLISRNPLANPPTRS